MISNRTSQVVPFIDSGIIFNHVTKVVAGGAVLISFDF
eukprot:XP_001706257.1 Hypothetical protein GL50803_39722 [Giardia lamblia ATCC 50803]